MGTVVLWMFEIMQMCKKGWSYFLDLQNYFDFTGQALIMAYCIIDFVQDGQQAKLNTMQDEIDETFNRQLFSVGVFMVNARLMFHLTVFSNSFRIMMTIIVNAMFQLYDFMMVLYMIVVIIAICNFVVDDENRLSVALSNSYQTMFGENLGDLAN